MRLKLVFCLSVLLFLGANPISAESARGFVYLDRDQDGKRDPEEKGLPGVLVSNGVEVVQTDSQGGYSIPAIEGGFVFVVKPRGMQTRIDPLHLPRFYYTHKPAGSPDEGFRFQGSPPTGPLPASIDFALSEVEEPDTFDALIVGDPQPASRAEVGHYAHDVVSELLGRRVLMGLSMGDLVGDDLALYGPLNRVQSTVGVPWYNLHGNHDMNFDAEDDPAADETYEHVYGPTDYAFQYGRVHFILLDDVYWRGRQLDAAGNPTNGNYEPRILNRQVRFVGNYCGAIPEEDLVIVAMHIPLTEVLANEQGRAGALGLLKVLADRPNVLTLSAHTHMQHHYFLGADEGFESPSGAKLHHYNMGTASGSWYRGPVDDRGLPAATMRDGTPNGYVLAHFEGPKYSFHYKPAGEPSDYQMELYMPDRVGSSEGSQVLANIFAGSERSVVRMRIDGGPWSSCELSPQVWPPYAALCALDKQQIAAEGSGRTPLPDPAESPHVWRGTIPAGLAVGGHVVEFEEVDQFNATHRAQRAFEVD